MHGQHTSAVLLLVITAVAAVALAFFAWRQRHVLATKPFAALMLTGGIWSLGYALELSSADLAAKIFWVKIYYAGIVLVPLAWLTLALQYIGQSQRLTRRNLALLAAVPAITLLLIWTNDAHGLFWSAVRLDTSGPFPMLDWTRGAWFWVYALCSNLLILFGVIVLLQTFGRSPRPYRRQVAALLTGAFVPWAANAAYMFGLSPFPLLDLTPFAFAVSGLAMVWGLFGFQLLDIVPVARDLVIESLDEGVFVLDAQNRIVDLNPAAARIVGGAPPAIIGQPAARVFGSEPGLVERYRDVLEARAEITVGQGDQSRTFDLHISPLHDRRGRVVGRVIVLHDVSPRKRVEEELRYLSTHDVLTGLYNRACFEEELARLRGEGPFPVSIIVADMNGLKAINDQLGHAAGDLALRQTAGILRAAFRAQDMVARIGGDEFAVLLPATDAPAAAQALTRIRHSLRAHNAAHSGPPIVLSLGTATAERPGQLSWALRAADDDMYRDKAQLASLDEPSRDPA